MHSIFMDRSAMPADKDLGKAIGNTFALWNTTVEMAKKAYPDAEEEWNFSGAKYGWSFRVKDKKRVIIYLLPRDKYFKVSMVFGQKATDEILKSNIGEAIKTELQHAKVYAEGRGIRIDIKNRSILKDINKLIAIKVAH